MKVTMLIGCSYSGKTTYAQKHKKDNTVIISSDVIRKELYGDENCQKNHWQVFQICRDRMHEALLNNKNVILDATFMTRKSRRSFLQDLQKYEDKVTVTARVFVVPLDVLDSRTNKRERKVPWEVVMRQLKSFEFPLYGEGFNNILLQGVENVKNDLRNDLITALKIPHDSKWHKETIGEHLSFAYYHSVYQHYPYVVSQAAQYHDIGKIYTKVFEDYQGNKTEEAHFYGHAGVGAYLYAAKYWLQESTIEIAQLISYHMIWINMGQKKLEEIHQLMGDNLWKRLEQLRDCDEHGRDSELESIY